GVGAGRWAGQPQRWCALRLGAAAKCPIGSLADLLRCRRRGRIGADADYPRARARYRHTARDSPNRPAKITPASFRATKNAKSVKGIDLLPLALFAFLASFAVTISGVPRRLEESCVPPASWSSPAAARSPGIDRRASTPPHSTTSPTKC